METKKPRVTPVRYAQIDFQIDGDIGQRIEPRKIETDWAFLNPPFIGELQIYFNGHDILQNLEKAKRVYPVAHIGWLIDNYKRFMTEDKPANPDEFWKQKHILFKGLGKYSPDFAFYRNGEEYVETPWGETFVMDARVLKHCIDDAADKTIRLLRRNPGYNRSRRIAKLEKTAEENFRIVS